VAFLESQDQEQGLADLELIQVDQELADRESVGREATDLWNWAVWGQPACTGNNYP
jgi:hypothetical protein